MSESLFPSGPWTGFYNYTPGGRRHRMDLGLAFADGNMNGDGIDDIARFIIRGKYDQANGECYWTKIYVGKHDVFYRGFREGKGIWGRWEIGILAHGGFHIWPRGVEAAEEQSQAAAEPEPVDAIAPVPGAAASGPTSQTSQTSRTGCFF